MKKQELLKMMDAELLEKLYVFCYTKTSGSQEAQDLCSDVVFELVKAANAEGEIGNPYAFVWRIARNVYADFLNKKRRYTEFVYEGNPEDIFPFVATTEREDDSQEMLQVVYQRIAFLTRAYREVMILFYLDGLSTAEIAGLQNTSETAVRQRLFSARKKIISEVEEMTEINQKPVVLGQAEYAIWGSGNPSWGDPRNVCTRQFSKHLVWLCRKKSVSAAEAAEELHVPTVYVEEELEILSRGENGEYGLLRRMDNGRYAINFILVDKEENEKLRAVYAGQLPTASRIISDYVKEHREEYMAFPYLNQKVDWNLVLWQQVHEMAIVFRICVKRILSEKYFAQIKATERPFHVYGYVEDGRRCGGGWNGGLAANVCGYSWISLESVHNRWVDAHFYCAPDVANDPLLQLALRAVDGLAVDSLSESERESAARAIECGYLYRDGEKLYTKILVCGRRDRDRLFDITDRLAEGYLAECAEAVAEKVSGLIRRFVPEHLLGEWMFANDLAGLEVLDSLIEALMKEGVLVPPEDRLGAEGCWMAVGR